jgi:pimeloyl-ACP methyl ester carboxylesterase
MNTGMNNGMSYKNSLKVSGLGKVTFQKVGDLSAAELNAELSKKSIPISQKTAINTYDLFNENGAATPFNPKKTGAKNGIDFYQLTYQTKIPENNKSYMVSGLLAIPRLRQSKTIPLLSWQHGTILDPNDAPSSLIKNDRIQRSPYGIPRSAETLLNVVRVAGNGYILAAADYIGNGLSKTTQAYAVKGATQQTTADMLKASNAVLRKLGVNPGPLSLFGWSQGGLSTQWLSSKLQNDGIAVKKQAITSGPTDLQQTLSYWINDYPGNPPWLTSVVPLLIGSYEKYYGIKNLMKQAFRPEYLETAKKIYNKQIDWDTTLPDKSGAFLGLPLKAKDMLTGQFIDDFNSKKGAFYDKIVGNTALETKYKMPSTFYGGGSDTIVPERLAIEIPVRYQENLGSSLAMGINIGSEATHRSAVLGSLFGSVSDPSNNLLQWFNAA